MNTFNKKTLGIMTLVALQGMSMQANWADSVEDALRDSISNLKQASQEASQYVQNKMCDTKYFIETHPLTVAACTTVLATGYCLYKAAQQNSDVYQDDVRITRAQKLLRLQEKNLLHLNKAIAQLYPHASYQDMPSDDYIKVCKTLLEQISRALYELLAAQTWVNKISDDNLAMKELLSRRIDSLQNQLLHARDEVYQKAFSTPTPEQGSWVDQAKYYWNQ